MDTTAQALLAAALGAVVGGGLVYALLMSRTAPSQPAPPQEQTVVPAGVGTVLAVLRSSAVVLDDADVVLKASSPAYSLGIVRGKRLESTELARLVTEVRRDGQIRETELVMARVGAPPRHVTARIAPLGSRLVLLLVEDRTRERRVEAVRRDFVANVSHELKTPVGAIRLLAEALDEAADDAETVRRFAGRMTVESDRLAELVGQVIELSRLQGDEPVDEAVQVDLDRVIETAVDTCSIDAAAKDIALITDTPSHLYALGSPDQVTAAVSNLISNAVTYSDPDSTVSITTKAVKGSIEISVLDQGIGIPKPELDRIFERFYRVDPARHRSTGGTGLGLSIVKHVAATHGGDVRVWSEEGQGSTFTLSLPAFVPTHTETRGPLVAVSSSPDSSSTEEKS